MPLRSRSRRRSDVVAGGHPGHCRRVAAFNDSYVAHDRTGSAGHLQPFKTDRFRASPQCGGRLAKLDRIDFELVASIVRRRFMAYLPSCFVGSSSECRRVAEAVQRRLSGDLAVTLWTQVGFELSKPTLETLMRELRRYDYAIFVFAPDDVVRLRKKTMLATRDNVMFELGLFMASLGPERCFFLLPHTEKPFRIPSDLAGLTAAMYDLENHGGNIDGALGVPCSRISETVRTASNLSGNWNLYIEESLHPGANGVMHLTCADERAAAHLSLRKNAEGKSVARDFRYEGRYVSGQFAFTFSQGDAEDQIVGSMVIRSNSGRTEMVGQTVFWHHDRAKLVATYFVLRRT